MEARGVRRCKLVMIEVNDLRKTYRRSVSNGGFRESIKNIIKPKYIEKVAVNNISFKVNTQETIGYIGTNGSGKSTTIKMLTGILTPTSGSIKVNGIVPHKNRIKNNFNTGVVFGQRTQLWWDIPVIDSYKLIKQIYEVENEKFNKNLDEAVKLLKIEDIIGLPPRQLSLGQKMKCELASVFLYKPSVIFLDEPTLGLDINAKEMIRNYIKKLNTHEKTTIFLTSHDFQDIEYICNRIIILDKGNIIWDGPTKDIKEKFSSKKILKLKVSYLTSNDIEVLQKYNELFYVKYYSSDIIEVEVNTSRISLIEAINCIGTCVNIVDISVKEESLENIIRDNFY